MKPEVAVEDFLVVVVLRLDDLVAQAELPAEFLRRRPPRAAPG